MKNQPIYERLARHLKAMFVASDERGELLPVVVTEKNGVPGKMAIAPLLDRDAALIAAKMLWHGSQPDALIVLLDAHVRQYAAKTPEDIAAYQAAMANYQRGQMQRECDEEGACDRGELVDVIHVHRIDRDGSMSSFTLPYAYHGKEGGIPFRWLDEHPCAMTLDEREDGQRMGGEVPAALREIVSEPQDAEMLALNALGMMDYRFATVQMSEASAEAAASEVVV